MGKLLLHWLQLDVDLGDATQLFSYADTNNCAHLGLSAISAPLITIWSMHAEKVLWLLRSTYTCQVVLLCLSKSWWPQKAENIRYKQDPGAKEVHKDRPL